jgi:hypothetical protein
MMKFNKLVLVVLLLGCASVAQPQSCVPAPSGLMSWWTGDTNENDLTGANNPVAVNAVSLVAAEVSQGFTFGTDGYIQMAPSASLANQQYTWAAWVRPDGPGSTNDQYGSVILLQNADSQGDVLAMDWRSNPDSRFLVTFGNQVSETIYSSDIFPAGSFYHVVTTYDGTTFQLYVNGVLEAALAESKTIAYNNNSWVIGESFALRPNFRHWNGVIDEVQAYSRALSATEIRAIYNAGSAGVCKGLNFSPTSLRFGRRPVGSTSPAQSITVNNALPIPVMFGKVAIGGDFAQTNNCPSPGSSLAPGASCATNVTFTPTAIGTRTGALTIGDNAPASPQRVGLSGAATDIAVAPAKLDFGSTPVGGTGVTKGVKLTNVGTVAVNFTGAGITVTGADPGDFVILVDHCGTSLAAGASCTVGIRFQPAATGARSATLSMNDDGGSSPQTVPLTGSGT